MRTGDIARREVYLGRGRDIGPITPKIHVGHNHGPVTPHVNPGAHYNSNVETIKEIVKLFD